MLINKAIYIKLGEAGCWEKDSIENNKIRFGWRSIQFDLILKKDWSQIRQLIESDFSYRGKKNGSTNDFNALKSICDSDEYTVFVTFHAGKMYWCTPKTDTVCQDSISKYLETKTSWSSENIDKSRVFYLNKISGRLTKYQLFMGTVCNVGNKLNELRYLTDIINGIESQEYQQLAIACDNLKEAMIPALRNLIPKDFEILIDLIYRNSGWKRTSVLGEVMKFFDLVLEEPFSKKVHGVQIKTGSNLKEYQQYTATFLNDYQTSFESLFYAVHTPDKKLEEYIEENDKIKLLKLSDIADLAIDAGLITWIMDRSK